MEMSCTQNTVILNTATDKYLSVHTGKYWHLDPLYVSSINSWLPASSAQWLVSFSADKIAVGSHTGISNIFYPH